MAKMTLEEAQNKVFDVEKLSDAEILRMNKLLQAESSKESATEDDKTATGIVVSEIESRLETYSKLDSFELGDLYNVIAMAEAVSGFSKQADLAKEVLARARAQEASLTPEQINEADLEEMMKDPSYSKEDLDLALDEAVAYEQEILKNKEQEAGQQQTAENVQPEESKKDTTETKEDEPNKSHHDQVMEDVDQQLLDLASRSKNNKTSEQDSIRKMKEERVKAGKEAEAKLDELLAYAQANGFKTAIDDKEEIIKHTFGNNPYLDNIQKLWNQGHPKEEIDIYEITKAIRLGQTTQKSLEVKEENGQYSYTVLDKDDKVISSEYGLDAAAISGKMRENPEFSKMKENQSSKDEDTITPEADQALKKAEKEPESQEALNTYDNAHKVPQMDAQTLEANGNIMDAVNREFTPFARDGQKNLVHPEFQAEFDAMQAMNFTDDKGKPLSEEEQADLREDLVQAAMLEADIYARANGNGNPEDVAKLYKSKLKECIQGGMVATAFASEYKRGLTREQMATKMIEIAEKQPSVKKSAVLAHTANTKKGSQKLVDRIKNKFKEIPAVKKMQEKINAFDKRMSERFGKKYDIAKRYAKVAFKTIKNVAIYSAVGATAGPIGLAVLSAKSGYDAYQGLKKEAEAQGMSFKEFAKANKGKVGMAFAMTGLSMAGSALGLGMQTDIGSQLLSDKIQPALKTATRVLAIAPKAGSTLIHGAKSLYKRLTGDKEGAKVEWDKTKAAAARTSEAALGIVLGSAAADYLAGGNHTPSDDSSSKSSTTVLNDDNTVNWDKTMTHNWQNGAEGQTVPDADRDGIPDTIDRDAGHGWANEENYTEDQKFWDSRADKFLGEETTQDLYARIASGEIKLPEGIETPQEFAYKLSMAMEQTPGLVAEDLGVKFQTSAQFEAGIKDMTPEQFEKLSGLMNDFDDRGHYTGERPLYQPEVQRDTPEPTPEQTPETTPEPKEPLEEVYDEVVQVDMRTPQEQRAYNAILDIISKGEDMNNPEVRASVEGLAQSHLQEIQDALARGDNLAVAEKIAALHNQGENQELAEATRADENDSRKMANAKEDVVEAKAKLDAAKEALAQDPDNEKLQKEVAKLEQKFDKESLDLEQREIKEARSELKDQIKQDEKAFDNRNKAHETIEQNFGISEFDVNKKLAEMGVNINNLPEDKSTLSQEAQDLLNIRDMYQQAHQNEADLQNRIQENEQLREDLKDLEKESKAEEKAVKRGEGLSVEAQERLAGQSQVENSELLNSVVGMQNEQTQIQELNESRGKNAYEQNMANEEQKIIENHNNQNIGRQLSELRGTVNTQPTAAVQQTTVNQNIIQNQGGRQ